MEIVRLDELPPLSWKHPTRNHTCLVLSLVGDYFAELSVSEQTLVNHAIETRRHEFSSGRRAAHAALSHIGEKSQSILQYGRLPIWPQGLVGNIAHSRTVASAVVSRQSVMSGVGMDVVSDEAVSDKVASRILLPYELSFVQAQPELQKWQTALYCAKESIYKAVNPLVGEYIGFKDIEVSVDVETMRFTAQSSVSRLRDSPISVGYGYLAHWNQHWLTVFLVT